jgi:hypothetical protein
MFSIATNSRLTATEVLQQVWGIVLSIGGRPSTNCEASKWDEALLLLRRFSGPRKPLLE